MQDPGKHPMECGMIGLVAFVALVAVLAAVALFVQSRSGRRLIREMEAELERLRGEAAGAQGDLSSARSEAKERRDEVASLRSELQAAKKKSFEQAEAAKKNSGASAREAEIEKLNTRLAEAKAEVAHKADKLRVAEQAAERQAKEVDRLRTELERKPAPQAPASAPAPEKPAPVAAPVADSGEVAVQRDRADKAEAKLAETRKRVADLEKDVKGLRGRLETERRVFMVQKSEIELAGDRYAELRRRFDGLRRDHEELLDAVRQAAKEERRLAETGSKNPTDGGAPAGQ